MCLMSVVSHVMGQPVHVSNVSSESCDGTSCTCVQCRAVMAHYIMWRAKLVV